MGLCEQYNQVLELRDSVEKHKEDLDDGAVLAGIIGWIHKQIA